MTKQEKIERLRLEVLTIYKELPPFVDIDGKSCRIRTNTEVQIVRLAKIVQEILEMM